MTAYVAAKVHNYGLDVGGGDATPWRKWSTKSTPARQALFESLSKVHQREGIKRGCREDGEWQSKTLNNSEEKFTSSESFEDM